MIWVTEEGKETTTTFRRELLTKCQKEFEKEKKDDKDREKMQKAVEEAETVSSISSYLPLFFSLSFLSSLLTLSSTDLSFCLMCISLFFFVAARITAGMPGAT